MDLPISIPNERTIGKMSHSLTFRVDVAKAIAPLLISKQALTHMQGRMDFSTFTLEIPNQFDILLTKSSTGHVLPPGIINQTVLPQVTRECRHVCPVRKTPAEIRHLSDAEVLKIHQQLGRFEEKQLVDLRKFGGCKVDSLPTQRIPQKCNCQRSAHRITPPCGIELGCPIRWRGGGYRPRSSIR